MFGIKLFKLQGYQANSRASKVLKHEINIAQSLRYASEPREYKMAFSFVFLAEFARRATIMLRGKGPSIWFMALIFIVAYTARVRLI